MVNLAAISPANWYYLGLAVVVSCTVIMAVIAYRTWAEANEDVAPASPGELLESFEQARAAGELDDEEYERVRSRIHGTDAAPRSKPKPGAD